MLWKLPVGFQERLQALSSLEGTISLSEKSPASNKNLLFPVLVSLTAAENQEPKARRRAAGALQVASCPQLWAMLPTHPSVALQAQCFMVSPGTLGRLSQALRDAIELPLRKPTAVFCGHGQTMHTGMDHTFSRK